MIKMKHSDIWYWYLRIEEARNSGLSPKEYCDKYDVEYKKFCNMRYRIEYKKYTKPGLYAKELPIARKYMASGESISKYAKANNIDIRILSEFTTHLGYLDIIEKLKEEPPQKEETMNFIQVPKQLTTRAPEAEIVEKKNDIELIISKGVKVIVAPEVGTEKLIKIIELLKEL